ncbi:integral membrane sensor signal transduction histidine kinase [Serratia sp. AS12]|uniref:sensor histidine kinase n=1 Tax=Serratia TaxID=613 RepID=UPI00020E9FED|nr:MULTISPECIES: ATP-binding protein [Serratia]AEF46374.1 integral membrane sensor signal transduction histidine kinase [Serratia plymuthica AS9]AEF51326.1 integral membrane sensor signal transduction histidine kinase [Serratia sp. AS12]AEG29034.1 integral membrane sensor signal transduction histidine kinase [Serratia sp. AS13]UTN95095.1 ATP-binding protein [Serratia plymuthica]
MNKPAKQASLWRWIWVRIVLLAVGSIILIAGCLWSWYALINFLVLQSMPTAVRQEFLSLLKNPESNLQRFHEMVDAWYGIESGNPFYLGIDWALLAVYTTVILPFIVLLALYAVRPLSEQFTRLAMAARAISRGKFTTRAELTKNAPIELIKLVNDFNTMTERLAHFDRELKASHAAMAHELRSPLTAAMGRLQGMIDGVFLPETHHLKLVMNQLTHLNQLIDDLSLLSMAQAGQLPLNKSPVDVIGLLWERKAWLQPQAEAVGFSFNISARAPLIILVDSVRLGQVFTILMDNALRYAVEGKTLDITLHDHPDHVAIAFRDHGATVNHEFIPQMFDRFSRADSSRARNSGGSGLGLSIARAICQLHDGSLIVNSHPEGGMRFIIQLPVKNILS